jgi:hypothetical protein
MNYRVLLIGALLASAAGCRQRKASAGGSYADKMQEYAPQVETALGVKFKTPPKLEIRTHDQVREFLLQRMQDPAIKKQLASQEALYKALGLAPDTLHFSDLMVKLLTEQIIGYYDPKTKVLYVVQGSPEDYAGITIMHELVHALQDQYVNLDSLERITNDDDRAAAAQAVIEGEATYEQLYIMSGGGNNIAAQFPGGWDTMRQTIRDNVKSQPVFSSAPRALQESMLFPYINGADFVRRFKGHYGKRLPFDSLPITTKQLMHDSAYFGAKKDLPSEIMLPSIPGTIDVNTMGEFGTRVYIYTHTRVEDLSICASNGWDGDKYALVKMGTGYGVVWVSVWDQRQDGIEFIDAIDQVMRQRFGHLPRVTGEKRRFDTGNRTVEVDVREVDGRPVVLYVDVPAGQSTNIIDFSQVKIVPR